MKKNAFNIMFLSSALLLALCGCQDPNTSVDPTDLPSNEDSSVPATDTATSTPAVEDTSSNGNVEERPALKVELNRKIYIQGEGEELDVKEVLAWSAAYQEYTPAPFYEKHLPTECTNGPAKATVSVGIRAIEVDIFYYDSVDKAVAAHPIEMPEDISKYYNEKDYVKNGKLTFTSFMENGNLYVTDPAKTASVMKSAYNKATVNPSYNANYIDAWTEEGTVAATYDATKKTIPHYSELVPGEEGAEPTEVSYPHTTYLPPENTYSQNLMYEIITEADGSIAYFAQIKHTADDPILPTSIDSYWSKYKDYTQNPCFIYADDYDAVSNPTAFEKVMPEGGQWIVGVNNSPATQTGLIDGILREMTGNSSITCYGAISDFKLVYGDPADVDDQKVEAKLLDARVKCILNSRGNPAVGVFNIATPQYSFAYYAFQATKVSDATLKAELLADKEVVLSYMVYLALPEVTSEPVLYNYYSAASDAKIAEWVSKFPSEA